MNGLTILVSLMDAVIGSFDVKPSLVTLVGDSSCTISAVESVTASLAAYFTNRVNEIEDKM